MPTTRRTTRDRPAQSASSRADPEAAEQARPGPGERTGHGLTSRARPPDPSAPTTPGPRARGSTPPGSRGRLPSPAFPRPRESARSSARAGRWSARVGTFVSVSLHVRHQERASPYPWSANHRTQARAARYRAGYCSRAGRGGSGAELVRSVEQGARLGRASRVCRNSPNASSAGPFERHPQRFDGGQPRPEGGLGAVRPSLGPGRCRRLLTLRACRADRPAGLRVLDNRIAPGRSAC